jgi:Cytochrome C and Quinol oxidase polypeptide I/Universal stress protein family
MRAPGLTWFRLPLFVWSMYAAAIIMVLATPVVAITIILVALERLVGIGVFDPTIGGDPLLFQHLFWFYSHPAVYVMLLPSMAVISEIIACFSRKRVFGYTAVAFSSVAIAVFGFFVWAHLRQLIVLHVSECQNGEEGSHCRERLRFLAPFNESHTVPIEHIVVPGPAGELILEYARKFGVDLVVLGSPEKQLTEEDLHTSTVLQVIAAVACPVLCLPLLANSSDALLNQATVSGASA